MLNDHPNSISEIKKGEGKDMQWSFITGNLSVLVIPGQKEENIKQET